MSQGLCTSCGAAVNLAAGQDEINCTYCGTLVKRLEAKAQFAEVKKSKFGGTLMLAEIAQANGNYEEAANYYNRIIEQDPTYAEAWFYKGVCILRKRNKEVHVWWNHVNFKVFTGEAVSSWKMAIKLAKHPESMQKRVAAEINNMVIDALNSRIAVDLVVNLLKLESVLSFALEMAPSNMTIAKTGIALCDYLKPSGGSEPWSHIQFAPTTEELSGLQNAKCKYVQALQDSDPNWKESTSVIKTDISMFTTDLPTSVLDLIRKGDSHKIAAIKELRLQRPGVGLAEAKKIVEDEGLRLGTMTASKGGCFIATACYGDFNHPAVKELRHFRDHSLETSTAGRAFVRWYYQWSPAFANLVGKNRIPKTIARVLIVTPALIVSRIIKKNTQPK